MYNVWVVVEYLMSYGSPKASSFVFMSSLVISNTFIHFLPRTSKTRHAFACQTDCVLQHLSHVCQTRRLPCVKWFITFYSSSEINIGPCNVVGHVMGGHFWRAYSVFIGECLAVESNFREALNNSDDSDSFYGRVFRALVVRLRCQEVFWGEIWNCRERYFVILHLLGMTAQSKVCLN